MGCKAVYRTKNLCLETETCIICRGEITQSLIGLKPGIYYPKCSLVVAGPEACDPLQPLESSDQVVCGVVSCDQDLTLEDGPCDILILTKNVVIDPNLVNWPDGFTKEDINCVTQNAKCCLTFRERVECTPVPECYMDQLDDSKAAALKGKSI